MVNINNRSHYGDLKQAGSNDQVSIRQITADDWVSYRDYYKSLKEQAPNVPHMFNGLLDSNDLNAQSTYDNFFKNTIGQEPKGSFVMFGMWHNNKLIGSSSIDFSAIDSNGKRIADFEGSEIAIEYRGRGLVDKFYDARKEYLRNIGYEGEVRTTIRPDNGPSLGAAERNGFKNSGKLNEHGKVIFIYNMKSLAQNSGQSFEVPNF